MGKKCGLRMSLGGLLDPKRPSTGGPIVTGGIRGAIDMAEGGIVRGKGGPTDDEVPMQVAGKNVNLSNTEAVLPAKTVQALGGPEAVEALIEQTNGKPPVKGGLREGGEYENGTAGWNRTFNRATDDPENVSRAYRGEPPKTTVDATTSAAPAAVQPNQEDGLKAAWWSPAYATAARLSDKGGLELENERRANTPKSSNGLGQLVATGTIGSGSTTPTPTRAPMTAPVAGPGAAGTDINVKGMTPEQRTLAADAYRNYVDQQTGVGPTNNRGDGPINYGGMQRRIDAYGKDPGLLAARNAREELLGSGIRMGVDGKGGLTINNTGDRSNGTLAAAGGTTMDMKGANEIYARANAIRGSIGADNGGPVGGVAVLGGGSGISDERAALLKAATTAHPGAQNGQLTLGQMSTARGLMGDVQGERIKAQELAISAQRAASEGSTKQKELGLRAQENASLDAFRRGSLTNDAQKNAATAKNAAQANYLAASKEQREMVSSYLDKLVPTTGLKDDDLKAAQLKRAQLEEAFWKANGGNLSTDPQALQKQIGPAGDAANLTLTKNAAMMNPTIADRIHNVMDGNKDRATTMYPTNTVVTEDGRRFEMPAGPSLRTASLGSNADLLAIQEQINKQTAAQK